VLQEISVSSADGASGYLEPGFITPKAHLFRAMKYGSAAASSSMLSPSDHDRSSTNLQLHKHVYTGFAAFSSWPHTADNLPVHEDDVRCLTLDTDCTNKFPATSFAAGSQNLFVDEASAEKHSCFHKPSRSQQRQHFYLAVALYLKVPDVAKNNPLKLFALFSQQLGIAV